MWLEKKKANVIPEVERIGKGGICAQHQGQMNEVSRAKGVWNAVAETPNWRGGGKRTRIRK